MPTAYYTMRIENNYGDSMEFEYAYDILDGDEDFDPESPDVQDEIYQDVMRNIYYDMDFDRLEE